MDKAIKQNYLDAVSEHNSHMANIKTMQSKRESFKISIKTLEKATEEAEHKKTHMLDLLCADKVSDKEFESAQRTLDTASVKLQNSRKLLEAINKKISAAEKQAAPLVEKVRRCEGKIWEQIFFELEKGVIKKMGVDINILYAMSKRLPRGMWFQDPLPVRLFPEPAPNDLKQFNTILDRKFEKKIR